MKPYYQDEWVQIYHGDCRDILPKLTEVFCPDCGSIQVNHNPLDNSDYICGECGLNYDKRKIDLVLTDPPYGLGKRLSGGTWGIKYRDNDWDLETNNVVYELAERKAIIWGGNYYSLPLKRGWLVWYKRDHAPTMGACELAWTNLDINTQVFDYPIAAVNAERNGHPTLKPLALMKWCIQFAEPIDTILDPFLGSGTTLRAAKELGKHAIGIEINEKYCEIAARRCSQAVFNFETPKEKIEQGKIL